MPGTARMTTTSTTRSSRTAIRLLWDTVASLSATPQLSYARSRDGVTLAFAVTGQGPPLVLVPWVPFSNLQMEYGNPVMRQVYDQLATRVMLVQYALLPPSRESNGPSLHQIQGSSRLRKSAGGGRGIRTPEGLHLSGFQDHRHRPLGHPSGDHNDTCG